MLPHCDITDEEWQRVIPLLPELRPCLDMRGRPPTDSRRVLNGVLWIICNNAAWSDMPPCYPSSTTCNRRFKMWQDEGVLKRVMTGLFGNEGAVRCELFATRMRKRASPARKVANARAMHNSPFAPPTPGVAQSLDHLSALWHAA